MDALETAITRLMKIAINRHIFYGEQLYILSCSLVESAANSHWLIASEGQRLFWIPYGAGGTMWPRWEKIDERLRGKYYFAEKSPCFWIKQVNKLDLPSEQVRSPIHSGGSELNAHLPRFATAHLGES